MTKEQSWYDSVSNYFGSSNSWWDSAKEDVSYAAKNASNIQQDLKNAGKDFFSYKTATACGAAWNGFETIAGKIISHNSGVQTAAWLTGLSGQVPTVLATTAAATEAAATALVVHPIGSMLALTGASILAAHPKATFEAIKTAGSVTYNMVAAGVNMTKAAGKAAIALGLTVNEQFADKDLVEENYANYAKEKVEKIKMQEEAEYLALEEKFSHIPAIDNSLEEVELLADAFSQLEEAA